MISNQNHTPDLFFGNHLRVLLDISWELAILSVKIEVIDNILFPYFTLTVSNLPYIPTWDKPNFPQQKNQGSEYTIDWAMNT